MPPTAFVRGEASGPWVLEHLASYLSLVALVVVVPLVVLRAGFHMRPAELGLQLGDARFGMRCVAVAVPVAVVVLAVASFDPALRETYPLVDLRGARLGTWVRWEATALVYYVAWEVFFRGVLLFGLRNSLGVTGAMAFQVAVSVLAHADKPLAELLAAIPAGVLFGAIALRTRSVVYVVLIHYIIGVVVDVSVVLGR